MKLPATILAAAALLAVPSPASAHCDPQTQAPDNKPVDVPVTLAAPARTWKVYLQADGNLDAGLAQGEYRQARVQSTPEGGVRVSARIGQRNLINHPTDLFIEVEADGSPHACVLETKTGAQADTRHS